MENIWIPAITRKLKANHEPCPHPAMQNCWIQVKDLLKKTSDINASAFKGMKVSFQFHQTDFVHRNIVSLNVVFYLLYSCYFTFPLRIRELSDDTMIIL